MQALTKATALVGHAVGSTLFRRIGFKPGDAGVDRHRNDKAKPDHWTKV